MATRSKNNATAGAAPTLQVRGIDAGSASAPKTQALVHVLARRRVRVGAAARDAGEAALVGVRADDVVRVEYESGLYLWIRADELLRERGRKQVNRSDGSEAWEIETAPSLGPARGDDAGGERGLLKLGIKVLEFFGVDLAGTSAKLVADKFEHHRLGRDPGLYRVSTSDAMAMTKVAGALAPQARPLLIFLHGTMSSCAGSFGKLWAGGGDEPGRAARALRDALAQRHGDQVYAFEHRTLTQSPIRNALDLVRQLPDRAELHLVSHSRGGLVGELLCLAERDRGQEALPPELLQRLFAADHTVAQQLGLGALDAAAAKQRDADYDEDRRLLAELIDLLDRKQLRVRRFARVACPARGTTLASGRLDRWLSALNLIVPEGPGGLVGDMADFVLAVVKERTDPRTLPGVEAMMPGSALTRLLHAPALRTAADLSVIAGDIEGGSGIFAKLKVIVADWFYGSEHDLVVNTGSMMGGIARSPGAARFRRDQGEKVTHFAYFANKVSLDWLAAALGRDDASDGGFLPIEQAKHEEPRWRGAVARSRAITTSRPVAVVIPGTMGSELKVHGESVWLAYWPLMKGGLGKIGIDASGVEPTDLLDDFYGPLLEHLTRTHRVEILPYDWRRSVRAAAAQLTAKITALLPDAERNRQPIHIVAHSMGGLVARAMIADTRGGGAEAWARLKRVPGSRLMMLGTPNLGSHEAVRWLVGDNPTQAKLILLDFTRGTNGVIDVIRRFPGVAELLPFDQADNPWGRPATWKQLKKELGAGWETVDEAALREAADTWRLLRDAAPDPDHMVYVAGCQSATVIGHEIVVEEFGFARRKLRYLATDEGDGTVTWASGRLRGVPTWYAPDTGHDQLCSNADDRRIFRGYVDLLLTGRTDQLPDAPPGRRRDAAGAPNVFVLPDQPAVDDLPDEAAVRALGFGGTRARRRRAGAAPASAPIGLSVRHGDLSYAKHPVLVGHYAGDTIVSAEAALDAQMSGGQPPGPLSRRRDLGLYPGAAGTQAVFFNENPSRKPEGALVVGLGMVGELSPSRLEAGVRDVLLEYALRLVQRHALEHDIAERVPGAPAPGEGRASARVSALLVGTGAAGLTPRESIEALLRGTLAANRRIEEARLDQQVLIEHVEILEMYEDLALKAADELRDLLGVADLAPQFHWGAGVIEDGPGRRRRSRFDSDPSWWQRIEIVEDTKADCLRFVSLGDRARAEQTMATGQLRLADSFIEQASGSSTSSPDVAKTLFEMLLPVRLKEAAPDQKPTVLIVDEASARFPWELLEDRWSRNLRPHAVATGMVRQLKTHEFRAAPVHTTERSICIVGNPNLDGWKSFADLPGARREAERVGSLFAAAGYERLDAIDQHAPQIIDALHARAWRVLHLAGHGEHEFELVDEAAAPPPGLAEAPVETVDLPDGRRALPLPRRRKVSGMVIGKNTFLTPGDIEQMRYVPELVFINCCHLGRPGGEPAKFNKLAANLGVQFIRMGVRAVVCAGWAVDDQVAVTFADRFYRSLLDGQEFGEAVRAARHAAWEADRGVNTWGAYQCYGDPSFRLVRDGATRAWPTPAPFYSPAELVTELRNLAESVRMRRSEAMADADAQADGLRRRVRDLLERVPAARRGGKGAWSERADVLAAVGFTYGEGGLFAEAADHLDRAIRSGDGDCPVRAAEQATNYRVRAAMQDWSGAKKKTPALRAEVIGRIEKARDWLGFICDQAPTAERLSIIGSANKRLAMLSTGSPRAERLADMAAQYRDAFDRQEGQFRSYTFNNWAVACLLLARIDPKQANGAWKGALEVQCRQQLAEAEKTYAEDPQLWNATALGDLRLVQLLLADGDAAQCERIGAEAAKAYGDAFSRGASPRELASIREHLDFLVELAGDPALKGRAWSKEVREALEAVRRAI